MKIMLGDGKESRKDIELKFSRKKKSSNDRNVGSVIFGWWSGFVVVSFLSLVTRLFKIHKPPHVCWDETHFGKMSSWYINRTLFFDVHPPLGKMLIAFGGLLSGYDGSFLFSKPGDLYPDDLPYVFMRCFCALFGSAIVPVCYCITWYLSRSIHASMLAACLIIFDTGMLSLSRYILLDPFLLFFITSSVFFYVKFQTYKKRSYTFGWWMCLSLTGISLACSVSVKFVGIFVTLLIGLSTINELWMLLGDLSSPMRDFIKQFLARVLSLVILPVLVYLIIFRIHFTILSKSGSGDGFFSSAFQSQLEGNPLYNVSMPKFVAYDSMITMKNHRTGGNYLHSHWHLYPEGTGITQQQVTAYSHKDDNNEWMITKSSNDNEPTNHEKQSNQSAVGIEMVRNGDVIRLEHVQTGRNLHSHKVPAPLTRRHYQVTCYDQNATGDENDLFRIDVPTSSVGEPIETVRSLFRLIHQNMGCALHSHDKQLPKWGWEQLEVTCNPNARHDNNLWNIEQVFDERLENSSFEVYGLGFLEKFFEFHAVMIRGNRGLKPKEGEFTSLPWQWPINYRGQPFAGPDFRVYMLGNPVIWWSCLMTMILFIFVSIVYICQIQRSSAFCLQTTNEKSTKVVVADDFHPGLFKVGWWLILAWTIHYLPFWTMGRVLYFHHYFPALIFSLILTALVWNASICYICSWLKNKKTSSILRHALFGLVYSAIVYSFLLFSPLSYGATGEMADNETSVLYGLKWLHSWDI